MAPIKHNPEKHFRYGFLILLIISVCFTVPATAQTRPAHDPVYENLDLSVRPQTDFFTYANGGWIKRNPIPPAYSSWGIGNEVNEDIRLRLKKINDDAMKANAPQGSNTQKIGDFYYTGLDTA